MTRLFEDKARWATAVGLVLYALASLTYLAFGAFNSDEAWYLYGSKLVMQGLLPYRDFAYTQMPLHPYVYGVLQGLGASFWLGRATSVALSLGVVVLSIAAAKRYAGPWAGAIAALLLAAFSFGVYFDAIVKTYAFVAFCFLATLLVLASDMSDSAKYPLALLYAYAAALVRISAIFFVAPVLLYALIVAPRKVRLLLILEGAAVGLLAGFFVLPSWASARWAIISAHVRHWGPTTTLERITVMLTERPVDIVVSFWPVVILCIAALAVLLAERRRPWRRDPKPLVAFTLGIALFAGSHLVNGIWVTEYLVPAVTALLPVLAIVLSRWNEGAKNRRRGYGLAALVAVALLLVVQEGAQHLDTASAQSPLTETDRVAALVAELSPPGEPVLALEGLGVAYAAGRPVLPGLALAQFSLQNLDNELAEQYHVVNHGMLIDAVKAKAARVVILTEGDWAMLKAMNPVKTEALRQALEEGYAVALTMPRFGQYEKGIKVYVRR